MSGNQGLGCRSGDQIQGCWVAFQRADERHGLIDPRRSGADPNSTRLLTIRGRAAVHEYATLNKPNG